MLRHEAFFYETDHDYVAGLADFVVDGLRADEPVVVVLGPDKTALLRAALRRDADRVTFADMPTLGRNPARLIPRWHRFVAERGREGRAVRGIGEPAWPGRTVAELEECRIHEGLLNLAFAQHPMWLMCPYDVRGLPDDALDGATRTHPLVSTPSHTGTSLAYAPPTGPPDGAFPPPPHRAPLMAFTNDSTARLREFVAWWARRNDLEDEVESALRLVVHELAANSLRHAGGSGTLQLWNDADTVIAEVRDRGRVYDPLVGRIPPDVWREDGRGLYLVNQLCDLSQLRSSASGTTVRVRIARTRAPGV